MPTILNDAMLAIMCEARDESDRLHDLSRKASPRHGEIAVGGEHTRLFMEAEVIATYLRALGQRKPLGEAVRLAVEEGALIAKKWNSLREYQVHIWEGAGESVVWKWHRRMLQATA
jgi:hypothetical protein